MKPIAGEKKSAVAMVASTEKVRRQNRRLILNTLRQRGALAHTEISEWTGLSSATVSAITAELIADQILLKSEAPSSSGRGRPRVLFAPNPDAAYVAIIRITSEEIECSLADYAGTLKDRFSERRPGKEASAEGFETRFQDALERLLRRSGLERDKIRAISISSKGLVDANRPALLWSPVSGDRKIDFEDILRENWSAKITLTNETQFAAQALANQLRIDHPQFRSRMSATLSLGHNIGLGIATETPSGRITSTAPAFGHMTHAPDGPLCRCGARGCIEAYAGFYAILRTAFEVPDNTIPANFVPLEEVDKLSESARRGDRMAGFAFRTAGEALGIGISRLMALHQPMPITIIGPGLKYFDLMQQAFQQALQSNIYVRFGQMPEINLNSAQEHLVFQGNLSSCLSYQDTHMHESGKSHET